jgi:hypothetical protein
MTPRRFANPLLAAIAIVLLANGSAWARRAASEPTSPVDQAALDGALGHLVADIGKGFLGSIRVSKVVMAPDSASWPVSVDQLRRRCEPSADIATADAPGFNEATQDMASRVSRKAGFAEFRSRVGGVQAYVRPSPPTEPDPFTERPIQALPPGFSKDRSLAIVRFSIPWSIHSADATYVLKKNADGWVVLSRDLCVYV